MKNLRFNDALEAALTRAKSITDRPTLIRLRSHIGWPSPNKTDTSSAHGEPLGLDEIEKTKAILGLPNEAFHVSATTLAMYRAAGTRNGESVTSWESRLEALQPDTRVSFEAALDGTGIDGWEHSLPTYEAGKEIATRAASAEVLNALLDAVPGLFCA